MAWWSLSVSWESSQTPSHRVGSLLNGTVSEPTFTLAVEGVFFLRKIAASVLPWSKATPLLISQSMDVAAAWDSLADTASSSAPSTHHPMSSTKDSPQVPRITLSTSSEIPDRM